MFPVPALENLARIVLQTSGQAAGLILLIFALHRIFRRRISPQWRYLLWVPVLIRLALPVLPASRFSLSNLVGRISADSGIKAAWSRESSTDAALLRRRLELARPTPTPTTVASASRTRPSRPLSPEASPDLVLPPTSPSSEPGPIARVATSDSPRSVSPPTSPSVTQLDGSAGPHWLAVLWVVGALLVGGRWLGGTLWVRLRIRALSAPTDPHLRQVWSDCQAEMGVRRSIEIRESPEMISPAILSLGRTWFLIPSGLGARFSPGELRHIFRHELAHIRRHDLAVNWLMAGLLAIHWFNPLVWLAFARIRTAREEAADALALTGARSEEVTAYGLTILRLLEEASNPRRIPGWIGILDQPTQIASRIASISDFRSASRPSRWPCALLLVVALVGLTDAPRARPAGHTDGPPSVSTQVNPPNAVASPRAVGLVPRVTEGPILRVVVLDDATGTPLAGAEVYSQSQAAIFGSPERGDGWTTDSNGVAEVRLGEVRKDSDERLSWYTLSVRHAGHAPRGRSWNATKGDVRGTLPKEVVFRLVLGRPIGGVVQDAAGHPLPGVQVTAWARGYRFDPEGGAAQEYPEFWKWTSDPHPTITGPDGRWSMTDFPRDIDNVVVDCHRDFIAHRFLQRSPAGDIVGPWDMHGQSVTLDSLFAEREILKLPEGSTLRVRVLTPDGRPVPRCRIREGFGLGSRRLVGEFTTDSEGRLTLTHRPPRETILTAEAEGFAPFSAVVSVETHDSHVEIRLAPRSPLLVRLRDETGAPVVGARINCPSWENRPQMIEYEGRTGGDGTVVWTNAPRTSLSLEVRTDPPTAVDLFRPRRLVRVAAEQREVTFTLRSNETRRIQVTPRVRDRDTGERLQIGSITFRATPQSDFSSDPLSPWATTTEGNPGVEVPAELFPEGSWRSFQLRIRVPHYGVVLTDWRRFEEGDWEPTLELRRGGAIRGTVRLPDGKPAAGAQLHSHTSGAWRLHLEADGRVLDQGPPGSIREDADQGGRFALEELGAENEVLITHPQGFAAVTFARLRQEEGVQLGGWCTLTGVLREGNRPVPHSPVGLRRDNLGLSPSYQHSRTTFTDSAGRFTFTQLPAGDWMLHRFLRLGPQLADTYQDREMAISLAPGEVRDVQYGGGGRLIRGQLPASLRHFAGYHYLVRRPTIPEPWAPNVDDYVTEESVQRATTAWQTQLNLWYRQQPLFPIEPLEDGAFRIPDVPPGSYELQIAVTPTQDQGVQLPWSSPTHPRGKPRLRIPLEVPPADLGGATPPIDLGELPEPGQR